MKLSACYIVRDEEKNLPGSLASVREAADEILVVDTGSRDRTRQIAEAEGARVISFPWRGDFAAARNFALEHTTGDWIIFLDADESFRTPEKVRAAIEMLIHAYESQGKTLDAILVRLYELDAPRDEGGRVSGTDYEVRVIRRAPELRYHGIIHENIVHEGGELVYVLAPDTLDCDHTGYRPAVIRSKIERNLAMLRADIARRGEQPEHPLYLMDCYFGLKDYAQALRFARKAIASPAAAVAAENKPYHIAIESLRQLHGSTDEMLRLAQEAQARFPAMPEYFAEEGMIRCGRGELPRAYACLRHAVALYEQPDQSREDSYIESAIGIVYARLAALERQNGEHHSAWHHARRAVALMPSCAEAETVLAAYEQDRRITACYIVRDETEELSRSLESLRGQVDDILIGYTGTQEKPAVQRVAQNYGAEFFRVPWQDDFSAARNAVLERAFGRWLVWLDADEYFTEETRGSLRQVLAQADQAAEDGKPVDALLIDRVNIGDGRTYCLRVLRNDPNLAFAGMIHEEPRKAGGPLEGVATVPKDLLSLLHTGYAGERSEAKARRNLRLLERAVRTDKEHPEHYYYYLADAYFGLDDAPQAEKYARLAIAKDDLVHRTAGSRPYRVLLALLEKKGGGDAAAERLAVAAQAAEAFPALPEFRAEQAQALAQQGKWQQAADVMKQALAVWARIRKGELSGGLEETSFNDALAAQAEKQLARWQRQTGKKQESREDSVAAGEKKEKEAAEVQTALQGVRELSLSLLCLSEAEWPRAEHLTRFLPASFARAVWSFHGVGQRIEDETYLALLQTALDEQRQELLPRLIEMGRASLAEESLSKAAELCEDHYCWEEALAFWRQIPADSPRADGSFWYHVGRCFYFAGQMAPAAESFARALQEGFHPEGLACEIYSLKKWSEEAASC